MNRVDGLRRALCEIELELEATAAARIAGARRSRWWNRRATAVATLAAFTIGGALGGWYLSAWVAAAALVLIAAALVILLGPGGES